METNILAEVKMEKALFAGGCFWCMEPPFKKLDGVYKVVSGYTGGIEKNPTYEEVSTGKTGHIEAVEITYDPSKITYSELLDIFWRQIDPTDIGGQFVDRGKSYISGIFYYTDEQRRLAEISKEELHRSGQYKKNIVTKIVPASEFYRAEEYHQDYYENNPIKYKSYRFNSGRDKYLKKIWGKEIVAHNTAMDDKKYKKPPREELKNRLTPLQYKVTQKEGTEEPFNNEYWDNKKEGIYVDIVSGELLFSSVNKYESGTGWPCFTKPIEKESIIEREDRRLFTLRTEVRSKKGDSHLGHVFSDGPGPTGLRYCINSNALRFIPKEDMEKEGYGEYLKLFEK